MELCLMYLSEYIWYHPVLLTKLKEGNSICFGEGTSSPRVLRETEGGHGGRV